MTPGLFKAKMISASYNEEGRRREEEAQRRLQTRIANGEPADAFEYEDHRRLGNLFAYNRLRRGRYCHWSPLRPGLARD